MPNKRLGYRITVTRSNAFITNKDLKAELTIPSGDARLAIESRTGKEHELKPVEGSDRGVKVTVKVIEDHPAIPEWRE